MYLLGWRLNSRSGICSIILNFQQMSEQMDQISDTFKNVSNLTQAFERSMGQIGKGLAYKNQPTLRIAILEEPLTAQNLSAVIAAITDLHARCWFIQQNRLTDLMDYAQTRDPRYLKEANLQIGILTHSSPAL